MNCNVGDDKWHQFALSFNNAGGPFLSNLSFYKDGLLLTNLAGAYNMNGHVVNTNSINNLSIGLGDIYMDDFRMYAEALSGSQVDSIFQIEAPINPCLVSKYNFTGNANDGFGSNNGIVTGATLTMDRHGNANSAYSFSGSDYIDVPSGITLNNQSFTLGFWAKRPSMDGNFHIALSQGDGNTNSGLHIGLTGTLGPQNFGMDFMFDGVYTPNAGADSLNRWTQWYVTYEQGTNNTKLYEDGQLVYNGNTISGYTGTGNFRIGADAWGGGNQFVGSLDDIRIFNCVLPPPS
jgi:hypothetical protein